MPQRKSADLLDPRTKAFHKPAELEDLGFGNVRTIYGAIDRGEIPVVRIGRKLLVPTSWVRKAMGLDDPAAAQTNSAPTNAER